MQKYVERSLWGIAIVAGMYAAFMGTTWHRNYGEALATVERLERVQVESSEKSSQIEKLSAEIERLKSTGLAR